MYFFEIKQIEKISAEFFELLEDYFGTIYEPEVDRYTQAQRLSVLETAGKIVLANIEDLEKDIQSLWEKHYDNLSRILMNSNDFKVLYCGNISPSEGINFIKKSSLYLDSLLIEDPLSFLFKTKDLTKEKAYLHQFIKHAFNLLDMKSLFFGNGAIPMLILFPPLIDENKANVVDIVEDKASNYFQNLFERDFLDRDDVFDYLKNVTTIEDFKQNIKNPRLLFSGDITEHFSSMYESVLFSWKYSDLTIGEMFGYKILGQFTNLGLQVFNSELMTSQIIFDNQEYWNLYKWDISNEQSRSPEVDQIILNSLQLDDFCWLQNLDIDKFNLIRNEEELKKLRNILRENINTAINGNNELSVCNDSLKNIENALREHKEKVVELDQKIKRKYATDGVSIMAGAIAGIPTSFGLTTLLGTASIVYGIQDFARKSYALHQEKNDEKQSLMGVLLDARGNV